MSPSAPHRRAPAAPGFDDVYLAGRGRLVLETYALTGDLSAAQGAVRGAFVAARQRWRRVGRLPDPEQWVRSRAWAVAQRRRRAPLRQRQPDLDEALGSVLEALQHLGDQQRKVLLLTQLAGQPTEAVARELRTDPVRVEQLLDEAIASFCHHSSTPTDGVAAALRSLAPLAEAATLPPPAQIHRRGRRRRGLRAAAGVAVLLVLTLLGGFLVLRGGAEEPAAAARAGTRARPVTAAMLLHQAQVQQLSDQRWRLLATTDNTQGTGINSLCQDARFADPLGRGTFVRTYATSDDPRRRLVQTLEISRSARAAASAYRTTLGWFAGCRQARLQLLDAYRVSGLGDQARVLRLRIPNATPRTYLVGVVRAGALTISTVLETLDGRQLALAPAVTALTAAVRNVCETDPVGRCPTSVSVAPMLPPPSGETPGTLAAGDLPVVGRINRPWVGTDPVPARVNVAATTCDKADFVRSGAPRAATRTFLVPQARLPRRFGITETYGAFGNPRRARAFVERVKTAMARCEKKDLGATVSKALVQDKGYRGSQLALWRLDSEIRQGTSVGFWMGVVRAGRYVAQVNFTPVGKDDIDAGTFQTLVTRARDRLFELPRAAR